MRCFLANEGVSLATSPSMSESDRHAALVDREDCTREKAVRSSVLRMDVESLSLAAPLPL